MKAIAGIVLMFLIGAIFISLFHMSTSMDMAGGMSDCPFMSHEEVLCPMNLADHIEAWKSAFLAITPTIVLLLAVAGAISFVASFAPHLVVPKCRPIPILHRQLRERTYAFSHRSLQDQFSDGILHPKVF